MYSCERSLVSTLCLREYNMCEKKILETIYRNFLPWCCLPFVHVVF